MSAATATQPLLDRFPAGAIVAEEGRDQPTWRVDRAVLADLARALRDDPESRYDTLLDLCGVDYPERDERFEAVYHLYSMPRAARLRLKVSLSEDDPVLPSLIPVWKAADWFEREAYDMFGLRFEGHPNLRRLLTHDGFVGHPLRKDYAPDRRWILTEEKIYLPKLTAPATEESMFERMTINIGPSHPAMHGTFRFVAMLDGERIAASEVEIGYLHRCFEKMSETHTWQQVIPYTDRLNYCSSFINNVAYCRTVEKLLGVEVPPRAVWARTILSEFSRIMDHCVANGSTLVDCGALTNFWYLFQVREEVYGLLESLCGSRLTVSACRIGGLLADLPPDFEARCRRLLEIIPSFVGDVEKLIDKNRIFMDRAVGIGRITGEEAVNWGWTGPCLRASGVGYDVRKAHPYDLYDTVEWEVPVLNGGDVYDRYRLRMLEIRQSMAIIRQLLDRGMPPGPFVVDDPHVALPPKAAVYNQMESMIYHFKLIMDGIRVPLGEQYVPTEGANGELGFYIVSDGSARPYRIKVRPPCFPIFSTFSRLMEGHTVSDVIATLGGLNIIAGELDR
ncbi:MAG: NADH dehydrogenase (quinone) subunit D [Thermoanaerobaculia bacterium]|nr:NADH dehydrogenase (quinone) subunit D [Thermoanaerobaculia bacterium]MBP7813014.1 NADH dehydrogenase (quinone) subunit D [Thermoanaerobaculia bacterium]MBP8845267.1 NADH dehydrogenase (quinone) subunit D [Thermoanaerobaculia bacterium]HPA96367.1 NADH dehydrogenase (quinone) subunit D [Thermoanaerobaculia bacterium]HQN39514.1 NADH dehydrogenase (quinone) subunit D [Thermoanaerobaculia bacterium]